MKLFDGSAKTISDTSGKQLDINTEILVSKLQNMCYEDAVMEIINMSKMENMDLQKISLIQTMNDTVQAKSNQSLMKI